MKNVFRKSLFCLHDFVLSIIALVLAVEISGSVSAIFENNVDVLLTFAIFPGCVVAISYLFNVYFVLWEYADLMGFVRIFLATAISSAIVCIIHYVFIPVPFPFSVSSTILTSMFSFVFLSLYRVFLYFKGKKSKHKLTKNDSNIMIIGAGGAGNLIINDIKRNYDNSKSCIKCIIDDDPHKWGSIINGVSVVGGSNDIIACAEKYEIDLIIFAIPSCSSSKKSTILNICQKTKCTIKILPSYFQLITDVSEVSSSKLREVQIEDLLGREPIDIRVDSVLDYVSDRTVLVTGGGGSIGSELCRQISCHNPKQLIIFDIYENNAYDIQNELKYNNPDLNLSVLIGSVRDVERLKAIFEKYKPDLVFHAAAHKHVPLMEDSPNESIKNNVFGTYNVAKCADEFGVKRFVLISTDKAVNPTNIMGASKRICEMVIQYFNNKSNTEFVAVRFGNVLGSNGSVIPLFKRQIENGGPITVTDPKIIRYFMTIPEAVSLVLQAGASAQGGEIFVLDMGEPVKILDLAENLIRLSGLTPYTDIKIEFTGLRPGEKMYEEKLLAEEGLKRTSNSLIHIGKPIEFDENDFIKSLEELKTKMADDTSDIKAIVKHIVPTYYYTK